MDKAPAEIGAAGEDEYVTTYKGYNIIGEYGIRPAELTTGYGGTVEADAKKAIDKFMTMVWKSHTTVAIGQHRTIVAVLNVNYVNPAYVVHWYCPGKAASG
jgi:hypothetical protein